MAAQAPDLMFLDIEMPGIDGFEVLRRVPQTSMPMVVFVTAFDRYAIDAFDAHALDYLLKPLVDERLERTLEHVREHFAQRNPSSTVNSLVALLARVTGRACSTPTSSSRAGRPDAAPIPGHPPDPARPRDRAVAGRGHRMGGCRRRLHVRARGGGAPTSCATMKQFEERLDPADFQRIHRSTIVNVRRIRKLKPHTNGEYFLTLDGGMS